MKISTDAFDRDACLFDATRLLSLAEKRESVHSKFLSTTDREQVLRYFALLSRELAPWLEDAREFQLHLFKENRSTSGDQNVLEVEGPARCFVFSSAPDSDLKAGSVLELEPGEKLALKYADFRNHFAGLIRK